MIGISWEIISVSDTLEKHCWVLEAAAQVIVTKARCAPVVTESALWAFLTDKIALQAVCPYQNKECKIWEGVSVLIVLK